MALEPQIHDIFEPNTCTWQYIVADPCTKAAVIIDPVLDYNPNNNALTSQSADALLSIVHENNFNVEKILETHIHADHVTAAKYLQRKLEVSQATKPAIGIGKRVPMLQERLGKRYGITEAEYKNAFDRLFEDDETFTIGNLEAKVLHLPGHTPDHLGYMIGCKLSILPPR
jgi:glyoxylase-like metal-dependent hydrolase (beta-lactamase superfamily II)